MEHPDLHANQECVQEKACLLANAEHALCAQMLMHCRSLDRYYKVDSYVAWSKLKCGKYPIMQEIH